mgnify:CR=1 FL=1
MKLQAAILILLLATVIFCLASSRVSAQPIARQPELADQIDSLYDRASTPANRQKFLSILIWLVLGGGSTYCVMRGIKKVVTIY